MDTITLLRVENARSGRGIYQDTVDGVYDEPGYRPLPYNDPELVRQLKDPDDPVHDAKQRWGDAHFAFASMTQLLRWWRHDSLQRMKDDGARLCVYIVPCDRAIIGDTQVLFDPGSVIATHELEV